MEVALIGSLLKQLGSIFGSQLLQLFGFKEELEKLKTELGFMQSYLEDVERSKHKSQIIREIKSEVRELLYDAEDVLLEFKSLSEQRNPRCLSMFEWMLNNLPLPLMLFFCSPLELWSCYCLQRRLIELNRRIDNVRISMRSYPNVCRGDLKHEDARIIERWSSPLMEHESKIVGIKDDLKTIKEWILEENNPLLLIGIVGMGGLGKTTIAAEIYNDEEVKNCFEYRMIWASVSESWETEELIKKMLRRLKVGKELMKGDVGELLEILNRKLDGRYLIVLDDVWRTTSDWWERLKSSLPQRKGSCIIVTTRDEDVALKLGVAKKYMHRPQLLSKEDSWSLFSKIAFARTAQKSQNPELEDIGVEIVAKCGGLPLAIKAVGGMMLGKGCSVHEWRQVVEHLKEEWAASGTDEPVISCLRLSYEELPAHLKPCLLCFAIFPEDLEIGTKELIYWWIGEGFVREKYGRTAEQIGEDYFAELLSRCLIEGENREVFQGSSYICTAHCMVRDMLIEIAREENFMSLDDGGQPTFCAQSRRIGVLGTMHLIQNFRGDSKLRALLTRGQRVQIDLKAGSKLERLKCLRVLDLSASTFVMDGVPIVEKKDSVPSNIFLKWIGSLRHLKYLNLQGVAGVTKLPDSIDNLRNLQILDLSYCWNLESLPLTITTLENLMILDVRGCDFLKHIPEGLGKLLNLQVLQGLKPASSRYKNACHIAELKNLTRLRSLHIDIKSENEIDEGDLNALSQLHQMRILTINSLRSHGGIEFLKKINRLTPPQQLQQLHLRGFPGEQTPAWLNPTSLPNLQFLFITEGMLTSMSSMLCGSDKNGWRLEYLLLAYLYKLEEDWRKVHKAMPSLRCLKIIECPKLTSFPCDVINIGIWRQGEEGEQVAAATSQSKWKIARKHLHLRHLKTVA